MKLKVFLWSVIHNDFTQVLPKNRIFGVNNSKQATTIIQRLTRDTINAARIKVKLAFISQKLSKQHPKFKTLKKLKKRLKRSKRKKQGLKSKLYFKQKN